MRAFVLIVTQEKELRFRLLKKEHGLLYDKPAKKTYAVVRDTYPTNWRGKFARAYLVIETATQTVELDGKPFDIHGGTVEIKEPLSMVAKIRMPGQRGEDGQVREVHLTPEGIYDRTLSVQVRRLGNRRFQWFHALLFVSLGVAICLALVAAITLVTSHSSQVLEPPPPLVVTGAGPTTPQSGPAPPPASIVVVAPTAPGASGPSRGG